MRGAYLRVRRHDVKEDASVIEIYVNYKLKLELKIKWYENKDEALDFAKSVVDSLNNGFLLGV